MEVRHRQVTNHMRDKVQLQTRRHLSSVCVSVCVSVRLRVWSSCVSPWETVGRPGLWTPAVVFGSGLGFVPPDLRERTTIGGR